MCPDSKMRFSLIRVWKFSKEKTVFKIEFGMLNVSDAVGRKMSSATSHSQAINRLIYRGGVTTYNFSKLASSYLLGAGNPIALSSA